MRRALFAALVFLWGGRGDAGTIYNDGGTHMVNGPSADIIVSNATTLNVVTGAMIAAVQPPNSMNQVSGIEALGSGTVVNVSGGSITGSSTTGPGQIGGDGMTVALGAMTTVTGGTFTGGFGPFFDGSGLNVQSGNLSVSGNAVFAGADGLFYATGSPGSTVSISGGTFSGRQTAPFDVGAGIGIDGPNSSALISGGTFNSGTAGALRLVAQVGGNSITLSGGTVNGDISLFLTVGSTLTVNGSGLIYSNGLLSGTLADGTPISSPIILDPRGNIVSVSGSPNQLVITGEGSNVPTVPEPASLLMLGIGVTVVSGIGWYRRNAGRCGVND
jgi:hypothetical protein